MLPRLAGLGRWWSLAPKVKLYLKTQLNKYYYEAMLKLELTIGIAVLGLLTACTSGGKGTPGQRGVQGPSGPSGATGPVGATGPTGAAGPQGPMGPSGPSGPSGPEGTGLTLTDANGQVLGSVISINPLGYEGHRHLCGGYADRVRCDHQL